MNRFRCPRCGGDQYTAKDDTEGCIFCGNKELEKMETLESVIGKEERKEETLKK